MELNRWRKKLKIILSFRVKLNGKLSTINVSLSEKESKNVK